MLAANRKIEGGKTQILEEDYQRWEGRDGDGVASGDRRDADLAEPGGRIGEAAAAGLESRRGGVGRADCWNLE